MCGQHIGLTGSFFYHLWSWKCLPFCGAPGFIPDFLLEFMLLNRFQSILCSVLSNIVCPFSFGHCIVSVFA